jgi:Mg-chelatase subunit ChlD
MANLTSPRNGGSAWRGRAQDESEAIQHRWQSADHATEAERAAEAAPTDGRARRFALGALLIAALVLLGFYVRSLLLAPVQTPVLLLSAGPYAAPFAPNGWAREDARGLGELDGKTLSVAQVASIAEFKTQLKESLARQRHSDVVVIGISMHGAVDRNGEPCLVPPGASPLQSGSWTRLGDVLESIRTSGLPEKTRKLLILDCNRVRTYWPQGTLSNSFADRLPDALKKADIPNLIVLNSVSPGERGWAAPELNGSVFGHYLRRGLAGKADDNNDRSVSLKELDRYLRANVDSWARHHYGESQRPMLLAATTGAAPDDVDFHLAWAYRGSLPDPKPWVPAVKSEEIAALWRFHDQSPRGATATYHLDPLTWSLFQQKLLNLEAANAAGEAYQSIATTLHNELKGLQSRIEKQRELLRNGNSRLADFKTFTLDAEGSVPANPLPDLALSQLLGGIDPQSADRVREALRTLRTAPTADAVTKARFALSAMPRARGLADVHFLRMLDRYKARALWSSPDMLAKTLTVRDFASRAAVPADLRTFHPIQDSLAQADRRRRLVEDRLFAGQATAPAELGMETDAVAKSYQNDLDRAAALRAACQLRDRVHAELPWLLAWLAHPAADRSNTDDVDRLVEELVLDFRQFRHALRNGQPYAALKTKVESRFNELRSKYDAECAELVRMKNPDVGALRRLHAVLSVPLTTGKGDRPALNDAARDVAVRIHRSFPADSVAEPPGNGTSARPAPPRWRLHPLRALLSGWNVEEAAKADAADMAVADEPVYVVEAAIRRQLSELLDDVRESATQPTMQPNDFRRNCAWIAERWRLALCLPLPQKQRDPVHFLRRFDLQQMLVWHAKRSLGDFWGRAGAGRQNPFFVDAARNQLEAAQAVFSHFRGFEGQHKELTARLDRWNRSTPPIFEARTDPGLRVDPTENVTVNVTVTQQRGVMPAPEDTQATGTVGVANISLWGPDERVGTDVRPFQVLRKDADPAGKPNRDELAFAVSPALAMSHGGSLRATIVFRGHEFPSTLNLQLAAGATGEVRPQPSDRATVTLRGSAARPLSIVFILDCSYSMSNLVRGDASRKTRHLVALAALKSMLGKLADRGNARVGVVFYGHRVAWNASKPTELLRQTDYARRFPEELLPLEDVEAVLPLGRFDDRVSKRVELLLGTLQPWGETPLYLAIDEALRQFAGETGDGERRIVVITDGVNNQRVPRDLQLTKSQSTKVTSRADLERAIGRQPVPVHILGFEMDSAEERGAQNDFRRIASQSKGSYLAAVDADSLLGKLTGLLGPAEYQLTGGGETKRAEFGKTISVSVSGNEPAKMAVVSGAAKTDVELHGGEALQLVIGGDGTSIRSIRYVEGDPAFVPLVDPKTSANTGTEVGLHAATRTGDDGGDVEFTVSLQRSDRSVSPRLPLVWIEVTPMSGPNRSVGKPYLFVDAAYAAGRPVPVLQLRAVKWPTAARQASFRVWCQPRPVSSERVPLSRLLDEKSKAGSQRVAGSLLRAHVQSDKGGLTLRVVQRAETKTAAFQPLKIDVAGLPAKRIVRQFDPDHNVILHRFEFDTGKEPLLSSAELQVIPRDAAKNGAWTLAAPATIPVRAKGELLQLTVPPLGKRN